MPYFKNISEASLHRVIFALESETHEKGHKFITEEDMTDKLFLVQAGIIHIETTVDDQDFVVESLTRGCILNFRNFLYKSQFKVAARCKSICTLLYIDESKFEKLRQMNEDIEDEYQKFISLPENSEESIDRIILDYILPLDEQSIRPIEVQRRRLALTNIFKNRAISLLIENKKNRAPRLRDILKNAIEKFKNDQAKKKIKEKDSDTEDSEDDVIGVSQSSYLKDVTDDIRSSVNETSVIINEIESRLINFQRISQNKNKSKKQKPRMSLKAMMLSRNLPK